jgi:ring-1,2-phenylacetyl-CoA epoxidase subunit PaaB
MAQHTASNAVSDAVTAGNGVTTEAGRDSQWPLWEVFTQGEGGAPHEHVGSVHAVDAESALQNGRDVYSRRGNVVSMWVVPSALITASRPEDRGSLFDPADDKIYRHPQFYKIPRGLKGF